ncbi:hypothetical protein ACH3XW_50595 [Acanthocheilonema viteae]
MLRALQNHLLFKTRLEGVEEKLKGSKGEMPEMKWTRSREEPEESVRELLLIPRTMTIAVLAAQKTLITAISRKFHPADFRDPAGNSGRSCKCRGQSHTRVWHMQRAVRNTKRVAHSRLENARAGWFLCPL